MGQIEPSPFLKRGTYRLPINAHANERVQRFQMERLRARMTLELLLHRKWLRTGRLSHMMQLFGDFGRKHFPWIGTGGWNGIGGGGGGRN